MFVARVVSSNFPGKNPPVFEGAPFVGGLMKFAGVSQSHKCCLITAIDSDIPTHQYFPVLQGPWKLMEEGYAKLGDAFTVPVAHKRVTFLIGPDVAPHFFKAADDELSQTEVNAAWADVLQALNAALQVHRVHDTAVMLPAALAGVQLQCAHFRQGCGV